MKWNMIRNSAANPGAAAAGQPLSHCAIGRIEYSGNDTGCILYFKSSITGDENDYIADYRRRNRTFPHETTGDQFFNEEQFEVYRSLGFHMIGGFLKGACPAQTLQGQAECLWSVGPSQDKYLIEVRDLLGLKAPPP